MTEVPSHRGDPPAQQNLPLDDLRGKLTRREFLLKAALTALIVGVSLTEAACRVGGNNTAPAYPDIDKGITLADFERGIDRLSMPAQRCIVLLKAMQGGEIQGYGHGVLAQDVNGNLMLYTAYHVTEEITEDLGKVHWSMYVGGNVGDVSLEGIIFEDKPGSGVQPGYLSYGVKQANLLDTLKNCPALETAIEKKTILAADISSNPNHDITTNPLVMYMADGNPAHDAPTVIQITSNVRSDGSYSGEIIRGGICDGMSGSSIFNGVKAGSTIIPATTADGRYTVVAFALGFSPDSTDPGTAALQLCSDDNINISAVSINS